MSKEDEARAAEIYKIQIEKQELFEKFGYRIKGGSFHYPKAVNKTFTNGYSQPEPDFGDRRLPPGVPSCLVKFNNGGGNMASLHTKKQKNHHQFRPATTTTTSGGGNHTSQQSPRQPPIYPKKSTDITTAGLAGNEVLLRTSLESYGIDNRK